MKLKTIDCKIITLGYATKCLHYEKEYLQIGQLMINNQYEQYINLYEDKFTKTIQKKLRHICEL